MEYLDFRNLVTEACNKMIKENKHLFILFMDGLYGIFP